MSKDVREQGGGEGQAGMEGERGEKLAAAAFVWLTWALCLAVALAYVGHYGVNFPTWDEYAFVPYLTQAKPLTLTWLWSSHNGHRMLLPRLVYIGLIRGAGGDFRAGMWANAVLFGAGAGVLILTAARIRGRTAYTDAAFALALLHLGHASCLMWSITIQLVMSTVFSCVLLALVSGIGKELSTRRALAIWGVLMLMTLSGANGMMITPPMALWLGLVGWRQLAGNRRKGILTMGLGIVVFCVIGVYMVGLQPEGDRLTAGAVATALGALEFLAASLGAIGMISVWPAMAIVTALLFVAVIIIARAWSEGPQERIASSGLLMFLGGIALLGLTVGWARAGYGRGYIIEGRRFTPLATPMLCAVYLAAVRFPRRIPGRFVEMTVFALTCCVFAYNIRDGLDHGGVVRATKQAAVVDAWAGLSSEEIAERNYIHSNKKTLAEGIEMIRGAGYGPFALSEGERSSRLKAHYRRLSAMFATTPAGIRCAREVAPGVVEGRAVLVVHAPGEIRYELGMGAWMISGSFGVMPRAWIEAQTDGVGFAVVAADGTEGERILFERFLDPVRREEDRGFQTLGVSFAADGPATLVLRTLPGPVDRHAWSFWTDIRVREQEPTRD